MSKIRHDAPWHRQSYDHFLQTALPALLSERLPLAGYQAEITGSQSATVTIAVEQAEHAAQVTFEDLPAPNEEGVFICDGDPVVVTPTADSEHLDTARIRCVGEQVMDYIADHLGRAPDSLEWDTALLSAWVPLDQWLHDCLSPTVPTLGRRPVMPLDGTNWLAVRAHLRRVYIERFDDVIAPGQLGLACPVETPEGPNLGHILSIAVGAEIRDGRLVRVDEDPAAILGLTASMIPLIEYDDSNRALMGANMMRQWLAPSSREPALVQSGSEPDDATFWCGRNLLTAFISCGGDTYEDAIVISQSAAAKLTGVDPVTIGDKLSNRHGTKGVIGRIIPDADMPHLHDGTAIEICFSFIACHARLNPGQIREAVLGRIAKENGETVTAPPFQGPDDDTMRNMLRARKLDESGMDTLTLGGENLVRPSLVGYVYWGQTHHRAMEKLKVFVGQDRHQPIGEMEFLTLRDAGATAVIDDLFKVQNADGIDQDTVLEAVRKGKNPDCATTSPQFDELIERLGAIGIELSHDNDSLTFGLAGPRADAIVLDAPVEHPWHRQQTLTYVAPAPGTSETFLAVQSDNERLARLIKDGSPAPLLAGAREQLQAAVNDHANAALQPTHLKPHAQVLFSGRGVIGPGENLAHDQIGLPEEMAWGLFSPAIESEVGAEAVTARTTKASAALDKVMAGRWVILVRAPAVLPTSILAFRPLRASEPVIQVPPLALRLMNGDFDGDQAAVFLPLTADAQGEAEQKLSIAAHLSRDSDFVLPLLVPRNEPLWAVADVSRQSDGLARSASETGVDLSAPEGIVTFASMHADLVDLMASGGPRAVLDAIERIYSFGFAQARLSGASLSPFIADAVESLPTPGGNDLKSWERYHLECEQRVTTLTDYDDARIGPQLLAVRSGARGNAWQLRALASVFGLVVDAARNFTPAPTCIAKGRSPEEFWHCTAGARKGLAGLLSRQQERHVHGPFDGAIAEGSGPLIRAMRTNLPGVVFAHAATVGEVDPLADLDSRLFVGV